MGSPPTHQTSAHHSSSAPLPDFKKIQPQVYAGIFPIHSNEYKSFKEALKKLSLNDASFTYEPESSAALGMGFRCGFLGMLHIDIFRQRLDEEHKVKAIVT